MDAFEAQYEADEADFWQRREAEIMDQLADHARSHEEDRPVGRYLLRDEDTEYVLHVYMAVEPVRYRYERRDGAVVSIYDGCGWSFYVMEGTDEVPARLLSRLPERLTVELDMDRYRGDRRELERPFEDVEDFTDLLDRS